MKMSIGEVADELGVSIDTLRRWEKDGKIKSERTKGGHRRYDLDSVNMYANRNKPQEKTTVAYARVSTPSRKNDLESQIRVLELFCASKGWKYKIIHDIGSGLNYNKPGFKELIRLIELNQIDRIVINYKDRLLRFGNEIIYETCKYHNVEVVIITESENKDYTQELTEDVLAVITVFSESLYGSRSHKNKKIIDASEKLFNDSEDDKNE